MTQKFKQKIYYANVNVDLMEKNVIQVNGGITINIYVNVKNALYEKGYIWNPATCSCQNGKYLASVMDIQQLHVIKL